MHAHATTSSIAATPCALLVLPRRRPARRTSSRSSPRFSILGDLVQNVGGDRVEVATLVGPNGDAHVYSPSPADAKKLADAKVVFVNGLGFEGWMSGWSRRPAPRRRSSSRARASSRASGRRDGHGHDHGETDPHAWQSVANAKIYVANIRDALIAADPAGKAAYEANAAAYLAKLDALEQEVQGGRSPRFPPTGAGSSPRHDAFGYFEDAYGIEFIAPQGVSTESEASASDVAAHHHADQAAEDPGGVPGEHHRSAADAADRPARPARKIGGTLYSDALTDEKGDAPTYIDMIRHNLKQLAAALAS